MNIKISLVFATGLMLHLLLASTTGAEEARKKQPEQVREFLHFGNMGGLLPTLYPENLPDPDSRGAQLLAKYCSQCHNLPAAGMHTLKEWTKIYWVMYWRMIQMKKNYATFQAPDYHEGQVMFTYMSKHALKSIRFGDVNTKKEGWREFQMICMQCHQLPAPSQHNKKDWRDVVNRMKTHMSSMGRMIPSSNETDMIVQYLKSEALD